MSRAKKMLGESVSEARDARGARHGRGVWSARCAVSLMALLTACGAAEGYAEGEGEEGEDDAEWAAIEQPITGGTLTTAFPAVVQLLASLDCTASKIGTFKFLTAAHCVDANPSARTLDIVEGSGTRTRLSIPVGGIQMHPSWTLLESRTGDGVADGAASADSYDVAVITTTTSTSAVPTLATSAATIRQQITVTGVGFGCDGSTPAGQKRFGSFDITGFNNSHSVVDLGSPTVCGGDSGGPGLDANNRIMGVLGQGVNTGGANQTFFMRMSNIRSWVNNPAPGNDSSLFQSNQSVYFMHRRPATPGLLGLCLASSASSGSNVPVQLSQCGDNAGELTGGRGPLWTLLPTSTSGRFQVVNSPTGGCLAPPNGAANANLRIEACSSTNERQKWQFITSANSGGFPVLRVKNHSSGLCMRTENDSTALGTLIEQTPCDAGTSAQVGASQSWVAMRQ